MSLPSSGSDESSGAGHGSPGSDRPNSREIRCAIARAERGAALDVAEATVLLAARGEDLARVTAVAARVRDAGLVAAGRPGTVTYSPKVFIPVTRLRRDGAITARSWKRRVS